MKRLNNFGKQILLVKYSVTLTLGQFQVKGKHV